MKQNITAIIYNKRGRILSIGKNSYIKTHTVQAKYAKLCGEPYKQWLHAEIHAIIRCKEIGKAYKIKVFRISVTGEYQLAKPCPICLSAIRETPIQIIEWT